MANTELTPEELIAKRVAQDLEDGWYVNLGVGLPLQIVNFLDKSKEIMFHSENGILGLGPKPEPGKEDPDIVNAGKQYATVIKGGSFFDSSISFSIVRGRHLDLAVVGAYQVSGKGDLANWRVIGKRLGGIGGAADLAAGAKNVWVTMNHTTKDGKPKIVENCTFPLTAVNSVSRIYTELAVFDITKDGLTLIDRSEGVSIEDIREKTGVQFKVE